MQAHELFARIVELENQEAKPLEVVLEVPTAFGAAGERSQYEVLSVRAFAGKLIISTYPR